VIGIDSSQNAISLARENAAINGANVQKKCEFIKATCEDAMMKYIEEGRKFDMVILDPPKFAHHHNQLKSAKKKYAHVNYLALQLVEQGGLLVTHTCSAALVRDQKTSDNTNPNYQGIYMYIYIYVCVCLYLHDDMHVCVLL